MVRDMMALMTADVIGTSLVYAFDPGFLKWILGVGLIALIGFALLIKSARFAIWGSNLAMAFVAALRYG